MGADLTLLMEFLNSRPDKTRRNYLGALKDFCRFVRGDDDLAALVGDLEAMTPKAREESVLRYVAEIKRRNAPMTVHLKLVAIRHVLELFELDANWKRVRMFLPKKRAVRNDKPVTKDIIRKVLPLLRPSKRMAIWFLFISGARVNEALDLRVKDFDLSSDPARVRIITEKSGVPRVTFLPRDFVAELKAWIANNRLGPDDYVFFSELGPGHRLSAEKLRKAFQNALRRLGLLERDESDRGWSLTIHGLRDNYKTLMTGVGVQQLALAELMGHDTGIAEAYYKPSIEELAKEWRKAEEHLFLEQGLDEAKLGEIERRLLRRTLESVWRTLHPSQPVDDLYNNAARFSIGHYPHSDAEKIEILTSAIRSFVETARQKSKIVYEVTSELRHRGGRRP
jgi:integrase